MCQYLPWLVRVAEGDAARCKAFVVGTSMVWREKTDLHGMAWHGSPSHWSWKLVRVAKGDAICCRAHLLEPPKSDMKKMFCIGGSLSLLLEARTGRQRRYCSMQSAVIGAFCIWREKPVLWQRGTSRGLL